MTAEVKNKIDELTKKAKREGLRNKVYRISSASSLHRIIRTPAQARRFMRLLKQAQQSNIK